MTATAQAPGASAPGAAPPGDLDSLTPLGVDTVTLTATLHGGRWLVEWEWSGQDPARPQTLASRTSDYGEGAASLGDAVARITSQAEDPDR